MKKIWERNLRFYLFLVFLGSFFIRVFLIFMGGKMLRGSDTGTYINFARDIVQGNGFSSQPLYQFFPLLLSPAILFGLDLDLYSAILNSVLSAFTVVLICLSVRYLVSDSKVAIFCAAILGAFAPSLLFWVRYVLTDTPFVFSMAVFTYCSLRFVDKLNVASGLMCLLGAFLLLISRPVAVAIVPVPFLFGIFKYLTVRQHWTRLASLCCLALGGVFSIILIGLALHSSPGLKTQIFSNHTVSGVASLAVRLDSNNFEQYMETRKDIFKFIKAHENLSVDGIREAETEYAFMYVTEHPVQFSKMCLKRFCCFYFAGVWQGSWSRMHTLLDTVMMLFFILGTVSAILLAGSYRLQNGLVLALCLACSLLPSLTHVDTDGRYRLPAEFLFLLLTASGLTALSQQSRIPFLSRFSRNISMFFRKFEKTDLTEETS